eukprot:294220-Rhodomonas_salina.7
MSNISHCFVCRSTDQAVVDRGTWSTSLRDLQPALCCGGPSLAHAGASDGVRSSDSANSLCMRTTRAFCCTVLCSRCALFIRISRWISSRARPRAEQRRPPAQDAAPCPRTLVSSTRLPTPTRSSTPQTAEREREGREREGGRCERERGREGGGVRSDLKIWSISQYTGWVAGRGVKWARTGKKEAGSGAAGWNQRRPTPARMAAPRTATMSPCAAASGPSPHGQVKSQKSKSAPRTARARREERGERREERGERRGERGAETWCMTAMGRREMSASACMSTRLLVPPPATRRGAPSLPRAAPSTASSRQLSENATPSNTCAARPEVSQKR